MTKSKTIIKDETQITILLENKGIVVMIKYPKKSQLKTRLEMIRLLEKNLRGL